MNKLISDINEYVKPTCTVVDVPVQSVICSSLGFGKKDEAGETIEISDDCTYIY